MVMSSGQANRVAVVPNANRLAVLQQAQAADSERAEIRAEVNRAAVVVVVAVVADRIKEVRASNAAAVVETGAPRRRRSLWFRSRTRWPKVPNRCGPSPICSNSSHASSSRRKSRIRVTGRV